MNRPTDFTVLLNTYLTSYLPVQRKLSVNTIASYCDTFRLLLTYMRDHRGKNACRIKMQDFSAEIINDFLLSLESNRKCSVSTRNQRLAALKAFFRYAEVESPGNIMLCQRILQIPYAKQEKPTLNYLTIAEMTRILKAPDTSTPFGRRDLCFLSVLYDTGARVSELLNLKVRDVYLDSPAKVVLLGKGRKYREVPLLKNTVTVLGAYIKEQQLNRPEKFDEVLFRNHQGKPLTRAGAAYILKKYADAAGIESHTSPHILRHTKAMHLLEANVNMFYIKDFLGHVDISTTEVYAKASIETQRLALEKHASILPDTAPSWSQDIDTIEWLKSFSKE